MCELCYKLETNSKYEIFGSWTSLVFEKEKDYIESPYKVNAYGDGIASKEIFYCPLCGKKLNIEEN